MLHCMVMLLPFVLNSSGIWYMVNGIWYMVYGAWLDKDSTANIRVDQENDYSLQKKQLVATA